MLPLPGKVVILIKEIQPMSFTWRIPMLHPLTTMSLIIVSLQIRSKNWHAAGVRSVVVWISYLLLFPSLFLSSSSPPLPFFFRSSSVLPLFFPFHFSIHGLESNIILSKGLCITVIPAGEKMKPVQGQPRRQLAQHHNHLPKRLVTSQSTVPQCLMVDSAHCSASWTDLSSWF